MARGLQRVGRAGRERELSRMLAGLSDSDTALAHARETADPAFEDWMFVCRAAAAALARTRAPAPGRAMFGAR